MYARSERNSTLWVPFGCVWPDSAAPSSWTACSAHRSVALQGDELSARAGHWLLRAMAHRRRQLTGQHRATEGLVRICHVHDTDLRAALQTQPAQKRITGKGKKTGQAVPSAREDLKMVSSPL